MGFLGDLFRPSTTGSQGLFNEANARFGQLRYLTGDDARQNKEIIDIISLCQDSILASAKNGDPHVLLANVLVLASLNRRPVNPADADFLLKSAACIMHNWANTPLCQRPFTKNGQAARHLHSMLVRQIASVFEISDDGALQMMAQCYEEIGDRPVSVESRNDYRKAILGR